MRHLEDAIHQMNGRVQGNQGHNGNNVNNVNNVNINNEVGINELIRLHRSSSSNRNVSVKLARMFFSQNELTNNRTRIGGERRPHGAVNGQLDPARLEQVRINYFRIVDIPELLRVQEWKMCCRHIDTLLNSLYFELF